MRPKPYPPEKTEYIAGKQDDELQGFLDGISEQKMLEHRQALPPVAGFRDDTSLGLPRRKKEWLHCLKGHKGPNRKDSALQVLGEVFLAWVESQTELNETLTTFDNAADFSEDGQPVAPNSELDRRCFELLAEASSQGKVSRETIRAFYEFGYFMPNDADVLAVISKAQPADELKKEREGRMSVEKLEALQRQVTDLSREMKDQAEAIESLSRTNEKTGSHLSQLNESLKGARAQAKKDSEAAVRDAQQAVTQRIQDLATELSKAEARNQAVALEVRTKQAGIESRLAELSSVIQGLSAPTAQQDTAESSPLAGAPAPRREVLEPPKEARQVRGRNEAIELLARNLNAVGVLGRQGSAIAKEVVASLSLGQMVTFGGSAARVLAVVCANTLTAKQSIRIRIPVGLMSSREFTAQLTEFHANLLGTKQVGMVWIDGMNLSAVEVYGEMLSEAISRRSMGLGSTLSLDMLLLATMVEGVAALPLSPQMCEFGPVLDTDLLLWKTQGPPVDVAFGQIASEGWKAISGDASGSQQGAEDLDNLIASFFPKPSATWRRVLRSAWARLSAWEDGERGPLAIHSAAFGWLLPRAIAEGLRPDQLLEAAPLAGDGQLSDERLKRMLQVVRQRAGQE